MKRKILFLVHRLHIGGAPKSAITWYNFLKKKNFDTKIVSFERMIKIDYKGEIISLDVPPTNNIFLKPIIHVYTGQYFILDILLNNMFRYIFQTWDTCMLWRIHTIFYYLAIH